MNEPTTDQMATTYRTLIWEACQVDSDSKVFDDLMASAIHIAMCIRREAGLPANAQLREMPYSEVCMHMKIDGQPMWVVPCEGTFLVQLYTLEGKPFSSPITSGEAGMYYSEMRLAG